VYNEEGPKRDVKKAYHYFEKALLRGVSFFDEYQDFFKKNYDELVAIFITNKKPSSLIDKDNKQEVTNLHEAYVVDLRNSFSSALTKDRMYQRPVGFLQDQQIWMLGILTRYFVK
jgi:hypothetical protein